MIKLFLRNKLVEILNGMYLGVSKLKELVIQYKLLLILWIAGHIITTNWLLHKYGNTDSTYFNCIPGESVYGIMLPIIGGAVIGCLLFIIAMLIYWVYNLIYWVYNIIKDWITNNIELAKDGVKVTPIWSKSYKENRELK